MKFHRKVPAIDLTKISLFSRIGRLKRPQKIALGVVTSVIGAFALFGIVLAATSTFLINTSSTSAATHASTMQHTVRTSDGTLHSIVQIGTQTATCNSVSRSGLGWFYSTNNGSTWTCGEQLSSDTTNIMYASVSTDSSDNLYVTYSTATNTAGASNDVFYRKLTKGIGATWTVGAAQTVLDGTGSIGFSYAVIQVEDADRIWIAARYFDGTNFQVSMYYSSDQSDAPTWTVSQAALDTAGSTTSLHIPTFVRFGGSKIGIIYTAQSPFSNTRWRIRDDSDGLTSWSPENVVSTSIPTAATFTAVGDSAGNVYFAQNNGASIFFNYWNGSVWSQTATVSSAAASSAFVSLSTDGSNIWVFYGETTNLSGSLSGSRKLVYKKGNLPYSTSDFSPTSTSVVDYHGTFDKYWSYNGSTYTDDTTDAGNTTASDTQMVSVVGSIAYFGKTQKFDALSWALSTNGAGGVVTWEYWNGSTWTALTFTASSASNFTSAGWAAFTDPADWALTSVNGEGSTYYYIRARTTTLYSTQPVGLQLAAIPLVNWASFMMSPTSGTIYGVWTENASSPVKVRTGSVSVATATPNTASTASIAPATIAYSSSTAATYPPTMRNMIRTSDGTIHVFIQAGNVSGCANSTGTGNALGLLWMYSTDSGSTWICGAQLNNNTTIPFYGSATVDSSDNLYVVYSQAAGGANSGYDVFYRKFTKGDGATWTVEAAQTVADASSTTGYSHAVIQAEGTSRLWIALKYYDSLNYQVSTYYSSDLSATPTWTISRTSMNTASTGAQDHYSTIVRFGNKIGVIYNSSAANQRWRFRTDGDDLNSWATESIMSTENLELPNFTAVSDGSDNIYFASNAQQTINFTYFNGQQWSATNTITSGANVSSDAAIGLSTDGTSAWVFYGDITTLTATLPGPRRLVYRKGVAPFTAANFDATATQVTSYHGVFDKFWSYNGSAYTNDTTDAGNITAADTSLISGANNIAYFGKLTTFDTVSWALSTNGTVGQVAWEYYNGSSWVEITDFTGVSNPAFAGSGYVSFIPPSDWATTTVNSEGTPYYYVRARAMTAFTVTPIATQLTTIPLAGSFSVIGNPASNTIYSMWTENSTSPTRARFGATSVSAVTPNTISTASVGPGLIGNSATTNATVTSTQRHIVRTSDGTLHTFMQAFTRLACGSSSASTNTLGLIWSYSTDNGATWNCGGQLSAEATNVFYASATVDSNDNVYVVYSVIADGANSSYDTIYRKLTKGAGSTWTLGAAQTMMDASSGTVGFSYATIEAEGTSRLWVAARYYDGSNYQVTVKYSSDLTAAPTWTTSQTSLSVASPSTVDHFPALVRFGSRIGVVYNAQLPTAVQRWRYRNDSDDPTTWSGESVVSADNMNNTVFTVIADSNGNVYHAVINGSTLNFNYWNGTVWSASTTVSAVASSGVSLSTDGTSVWVFYGDATNLSANLTGSRKLMVKKGTAPFSATEFDPLATNVNTYQDTFDKYWSYVSSAYTNDTTDAGNVTASDTQMVTGVGDIAYFGKTAKFDAVVWSMSTNGVAGIVAWEYYNGSTWKPLPDFHAISSPSFTANGYITFEPPTDWATTAVNGEGTPYYYVRARVTTAFSTPPVGLQLASIPWMTWIQFLPAPVSDTIYGMWTENASVPVRIRSSSFAVTSTAANTVSVANLSPSLINSTWYSSTAAATHPSLGRQMVRTSNGTLHAFIQAGNNAPCGNSAGTNNTSGLQWLYSTDSGQSWSCGGQISSDTNVLMYASATVDSSDNIYIVYSVAATGANATYDVLYRKLTKGVGATWTMESAQTAIDSNGSVGYSYATIEAEDDDRLWIASRYFDGTNYQVSAHYSDGLSATPTWTVSQTNLDTVGTNSAYHYPSIVRFGTKIGIVYNSQAAAAMRWRYRDDSDGLTTWNSEAVVSTSNVVTPTFSVVGDTSGNAYLATNINTTIIFNYFNGSSWGSNVSVSAASASNAFVSISRVGTSVYVYYGETTGLSAGLSGSRKLVYKLGVSPYALANFDATSTQVVSYHGTFDKYWSYVSSTFTNDTTDAASTTNADTQMVTGVGDIAYFGKSVKFDAVSWDISTAGIAGRVIWEYYNGSTWVGIHKFLGVTTPSFTADGYISFIPPSDWATTAVNSEGTSYYYVRARVITAFSTTPIGVQMAAIPQINWVSAIGAAANRYYAWTENATGPTRARFSAYEFNVAPDAPTALGPSTLVDGSASGSNQPALQFTTSDINVGDTVSFQIQIDDSSDFSSVVVDYTSAVAATGATTFTVGQAAGTGSYTTGSQAQTLSDGSYYWRVRVSDSAALQSSYTTANSGQIAFSVDTTAPDTNASSVIMLRASGGTSVASNGWINSLVPYFSWSAGIDNSGGSGVKGYCLYLGADSAGNPGTSKGLLGTSPVSTTGTTCQFITSTTSIDFATSAYQGATWLVTGTDPYYLNIKVIDLTNNVFTGASAQFQFRFDSEVPTNVAFISPASGSFSNVVDMNFSWPTTGVSASTDAVSGVFGWQYQINSTNGTWLGSTASVPLGLNYIPTSESTRNLAVGQDGGSIIAGTNTVYFRTVDAAGNVSSPATIRTGNLQYGGDAPSFGGTDTVTVSPSTADSNSFGLSWPAATVAPGRSVTNYYYMINTTPPATLATLQDNSATYYNNGTNRSLLTSVLPNVNRGSNTVYVVAVDDLGNYSPSNSISGTFTLNSSVPDNIGTLTVSDSSIKSEERWMVTLTWTAPTYQGAGNLSYQVYRSADGSSFTLAGSTSSLSYVDTAPSSATYYYKVVTKDGANAVSSGTNAISVLPTGKWTSAPTLDSGPTSGSITTKLATITWSTSRKADSKVAYGTSSGSYFTVEPSNSTLSTSHEIDLSGLSPGTTYYYKAKWTDEDGNTGVSEEKSFTTEPAPTVRDVTAKTIGLDSVILEYTAAGASKVKIYYGTTANFGGVKEVSTSTTETTYVTELPELTDGTKYYYKINTFDTENAEYEGTILSFTTLPRPKISAVRIQQVRNSAQPTVLVSWNTNTEVSSIVSYYPEGKLGEIKDEVNVNLANGEHKMIVRGLLPETPYILTVRGRDKAGNEATSDSQKLTTATDTRPAQITNLKVEGSVLNASENSQESVAQLTVSWTTDEPATSQVEYGEGTGNNYAQKTQEDSNLTVNHLVVISGLTPSKVYHLRALSKDKAANMSPSIDTVTITPKATDSALNLVISNLQQVFGFLGALQ